MADHQTRSSIARGLALSDGRVFCVWDGNAPDALVRIVYKRD